MNEQQYDPTWLEPAYPDSYELYQILELEMLSYQPEPSSRLDGVAPSEPEQSRREIDRLKQALDAEHALRLAVEQEVLNLHLELMRARQEIEAVHHLYLPYFTACSADSSEDAATSSFEQVKGQQIWFLARSESVDGFAERQSN